MTSLVASTVVTEASSEARPTELTCTVLDRFEQAVPWREEWDAFVDAVGGDIYFTFDWCRIWWQYYAYNRKLQILVFRANGALVGLMPLMVDVLRYGPLSLRLAKLVGSDSTTVVLNLPVAESYAEQVCARTIAHTLTDGACEAVWFGPLSGERPYGVLLDRACRHCGAAVRVARHRTLGVHTIYHLPQRFEEYLANLSHNERKNHRRHYRDFVAQHSLRYESDSDVLKLERQFLEFVRLHTQQWQCAGRLGHFGDWPHAVAFNLDIVRTLATLGRVQLRQLLADGKPIVMQLVLRLGRSEYWRLSARCMDEPWERLGVGRLGSVKRVEAAIASRATRAEAGAAHYAFKVQLGGTEYPLGAVTVAADRWIVRGKLAIVHWAGRLLHLLYYRIWFTRVAPRLGLLRHPLWQLWIRTHT